MKETFENQRMDPRLTWFCEPQTWQVDMEKHCLRLETDADTDFWRKTHYGFEADNGHFLYWVAENDFCLCTRVRFGFVNQYDQAGLMVRVSPTCWIKTSVEYEPEGPSQLGAVVTHAGYSDWSTQPFQSQGTEICLRIFRTGSDYKIESSLDGQSWQQIRLTHLDQELGKAIQCGLYACSPKGRGFVAEFDFLSLDLNPDSAS